MKTCLIFLFLAVIRVDLVGQTLDDSKSNSPTESAAEVSLRVRSSDPLGSCFPTLADHLPTIVMSAASAAIFTCDPYRAIWIASSAPPDTRPYNAAVTEYQYVSGTECNPGAHPACNVLHLAQLSGAGTVFRVQAAITPFNGDDLISFECDAEGYPGENTNFSTFFMEAFQTTDWKSRNIGGNVAVDGVGSYRDVMIPFTSGCTVDVTNNLPVVAQVFAQVEYSSGTTPPVYLEGDPAFTLDSNNEFHYSATEDFFGSQWYFQLFQGKRPVDTGLTY